jgi:hypothetical protein
MMGIRKTFLVADRICESRPRQLERGSSSSAGLWLANTPTAARVRTATARLRVHSRGGRSIGEPEVVVAGAREGESGTEGDVLAHSDPGVVHVAVRFPVEVPFMACDGLHPSEAGYREWARQLAGIIVDNELIAAPR